MKLKYYLRGMGIGILLATIVLSISFRQVEKNASDNGNHINSDQQATDLVGNPEINIEDLLTPTTSSEKEDEQSVVEVETIGKETTKKYGQTENSLQDDSNTGIIEETMKVTAENDVEEDTKKEETDVVETKPHVTEKNLENTNTKNMDTDLDENNKNTNDNVTIQITKGMTSEDVSNMLEYYGIIQNNKDFNQYLKRYDYSTSINIGTFELSPNSTYDQIVNIIIK